ncbi:MAG: hypothetical protein ACPGYV_03165 [Phycisphaeraceae bacterium]
MSKGLLYASTVGLIGAVIWAAVAHFLHFELGWLAWGIGAGVGFAMMAGVGEAASAKSGAVALAVALVSIVGGKYVAVEMDMGAIEEQWDDGDRIMTDETYATTYLADYLVQEYSEAGKPLNYPPGADMDWPDGPEDYPADVWADATAQWQAMSEDDRAAFREDVIATNKETREALATEIKNEGFVSSFSAFDLLWFALGGFSAFKLGAGSGQD